MTVKSAEVSSVHAKS